MASLITSIPLAALQHYFFNHLIADPQHVQHLASSGVYFIVFRFGTCVTLNNVPANTTADILRQRARSLLANKHTPLPGTQESDRNCEYFEDFPGESPLFRIDWPHLDVSVFRIEKDDSTAVQTARACLEADMSEKKVVYIFAPIGQVIYTNLE